MKLSTKRQYVEEMASMILELWWERTTLLECAMSHSSKLLW